MNENREWVLLRFVSGLVLLFIAMVSAVVFLVAIGVVDPRGAGLPRLLGTEYETFRLLLVSYRGRIIIGALVVGCASTYLFMRMLIGRRAEARSLHMLSADDQGFVVVDSRGIATIATQAAMSARGVVEARARVTGRGNAPVRARLRVGVYPGANIKAAGEQAREAARQAVEQLVGIGIRDVSVAVHVLEPDQLSTLLA